MVVNAIEGNYAPYASAESVRKVIQRWRERGLPQPLSAQGLEQIQVPATMTGPTLKALLFLGLLDEGGEITPSFERLRRATREEYPEQLAEIVRNAYLPVFSIVDPTQDPEDRVGDAFRRYDPANQRGKMLRLFWGLCQEAGIIPEEKKRKRASTPSARPFGSPLQSRTESSSPQQSAPRFAERAAEPSDQSLDHLRLISAIVQQLPRNWRWTQRKRDIWLQTMTSAIDLLVDVIEEDSNTMSSSEEEAQ